MEAALLPIPGLSLMFMLGLRHGFDPDHIAIIDSMAYRALGERPRLCLLYTSPSPRDRG